MLRFLCLILGLLAAPCLAQPILSGANAIQPQLVAETGAIAGREVEVALVMRTRPGWHGYWLNPGDAGLPMTVDWNLPKGWSAGQLRYPVPDRLLISDLVNYVYERDYAVLVRLRAPRDLAASTTISVTMRWLACTDKVCVPESGAVTLNLASGGGAIADPRFDEWRRALPRPLTAPARYEVSAGRIDIAIPLPASVALDRPYFFPAQDGPVDYAADQSFRRDGDTLIASLKRRGAVPAALSGVLALGDGRGLSLVAKRGSVPRGGTLVGDFGMQAILLTVLAALAGGVLLNLMPCVFPILALKALHLARSGGEEAGARRDALGYAAGAVVGTGLLGVALLAIRAGGTAAGWAFQLQDPRTILVLLLLATGIALNLMRAFELPAIGSDTRPTGSFGTGALAAFVATPCAGPFLGAALGTALLLPPAGSVLIFAALGLGLALPFVLLAFIPKLRRLLPRPGPWMLRFQRFLAIPMAATAVGCLWLLWRQGGQGALLVGLVAVALLCVILIWAGSRQRRGESNGWIAIGAVIVLTLASALLIPERTTRNSTVSRADAWSEAAVLKARRQGRPVFVDFTADWCLSCKVNEAAAIDRDEVQATFRKAKVKTLVADWTNGDPVITRFLERRGRAGVPLYLWYEPGQPEPEELPQILTPAMLIERAARPR